MVNELLRLCEAIEMHNWTEAMIIAKVTVEKASGGTTCYCTPEEREHRLGQTGRAFGNPAEKPASNGGVEIGLYGP